MYSVEPPCLSARVRLRSVAGAAAHRPAAGDDRSRQIDLLQYNTICSKQGVRGASNLTGRSFQFTAWSMK